MRATSKGDLGRPMSAADFVTGSRRPFEEFFSRELLAVLDEIEPSRPHGSRRVGGIMPFRSNWPSRRLVRFLAIAGLLVGLGAVAPNALADFPGRNGQITFMRADGAGFWQVWTANADLTNQRELTPGGANSGWPVWAPGGRHLIAFDSDRSDPDLTDSVVINDIFVMKANGTGATKVTDSSGFAADAAWSPDGKRLAFDTDLGDPATKQGIYTVRPDGTDLHRVTTLPPDAAFDAAPRFSPDGRRIVFTRAFNDGTAVLYVIGADGTHPHRVTPFTLGAGDADWSPTGDTLVFEADSQTGFRGDVFTVRPDGTHLRNITHNDGNIAGSADPVWSPDGTTILFLSGTFSDGAVVSLGLATMQPNGSHRAFVSATPMSEHQPDWQSLPCRDAHTSVDAVSC